MRVADSRDIPALLTLINTAYEVEAPFMYGDRIDEAGVRQCRVGRPVPAWPTRLRHERAVSWGVRRGALRQL